MRSRNTSSIICAVFTIALLGIMGLSFSAATNQDKPTYKITGSEATLVGTISFMGTPPEPLRIDTSADPICESINPGLTTDLTVVNNQKLANVLVYVRGASLDAYSFDAPSPDVTLEHKGCQYVPHVLGMLTQQTLKIFNSDPTTHNTHPTPKNNREWNQSQPPGAAAIEKRFASPELFIPIKDNQHPWEKAYVAVMDHPFFAVSDESGRFEIRGLPPGTYTLVVWHQSLGEQELEITVGPGELRNADFTFDADKKH